MGNNFQCSTGCCDRTTEMQPDNFDRGDLAINDPSAGGGSRNIMKPKKAPQFEVQDIITQSEVNGNTGGGSLSNKNRS
jgi:hypothetical protein